MAMPYYSPHWYGNTAHTTDTASSDDNSAVTGTAFDTGPVVIWIRADTTQIERDLRRDAEAVARLADELDEFTDKDWVPLIPEYRAPHDPPADDPTPRQPRSERPRPERKRRGRPGQPRPPPGTRPLCRARTSTANRG